MRKTTAAVCLILAFCLTICAALAEETPAGILGTINGEPVPLTDAQVEFSYYAAMYESLGMTDMIDGLRQDVADYYMQYYAVLAKARELGLDVFTDGELQTLEDQARAEYDAIYEDLIASFTVEGMTQEEIAESVVSYLESMNYTPETAVETALEGAILDRFNEWASRGTEVSEEDVRALYDEYVANQKSEYDGDPFYFEIDVMNGADIYYVPEGFRAVYHILLLMDDETQVRLSELQTRRSEIALKLAEDGADTDALAAEDEAVQGEIDALLADLTEKAVAIRARLDAGEDFMALMQEYGEDPGMQSDPYMTTGYYVSRDSSVWDTTFRDAAMALEKVGDVSEPVLSAYGLHLILYADDVADGPVDFETVRDNLTAVAQETLTADAVNAAIEAAMAEADIVTYPENLTYETGVDADGSGEAVG